MCGFVALLSLHARPPDACELTRMTQLLTHRGPDDEGTFVENGVGIGFRRLAIFDLGQSGHQPMLSSDGRHVIVFNGAIYNFIELRAELQALGHVFRSSGDTEVLLNAYRQWGFACLERLNGMWAFIIYDRIERRVFGARDRFGVKPLFWHRDARRLVFASEIKSIRDAGFARLDFDRQAIARFVLEGSLDIDDRTFYTDVSHVPAGCAFEADADGRLTWRRYWSVMDAAADGDAAGDPVTDFRALFQDAVRIRMRSDVPVGVLLSGGLDSTSIICSMARELGSGEASGGLSAICYMDRGYFMDYWLELLRAGRLWAAHREIRTFAGAHRAGAARSHAGLLRGRLGQILRRFPVYGALALHRRKQRAGADGWVSADLKHCWQPADEPAAASLSESLRASLERAHLPAYLRAEDRNAMAHGVEVRVPFLDWRLVTLAFRLGSQWKLRGAHTKVVLREAMRDRVPELVRTRMQKYGFPVAIDHWLRGELYEPMRDLLASREVRELGAWDVATVTRALEQHRRGEISVGARLFFRSRRRVRRRPLRRAAPGRSA